MYEGNNPTDGLPAWTINCSKLDAYFHSMFQSHAFSGVSIKVKEAYDLINKDFNLESTPEVIIESLDILEKDLNFEVAKRTKFNKLAQFYLEGITGKLFFVDNDYSYRLIKKFTLTKHVADAITAIHGTNRFRYEIGSLTACIRQQYISLAI